jgi:lipopolysaccharide heptosyltransferase II
MEGELEVVRLTKSSNIEIPSTPSILIILMGSLGDVARGLCMVSHIKANLPGGRVTWLVEPKWEDLVRFHSQIDRVIVFKRAWRISAFWNLYKDLNRETFDITLDLQRILKSGFFSMLSGAKRRIGFHRRNAKELNWIFNNEHIEYYDDDLPKILHYLKFTEHLGLSKPNTVEFGLDSLSVNEKAPRVIAELEQPFVAVVLGASWESKEWFFEGYLQLVEYILSTRKLNVVLVGDHAQQAMAKDLTAKVEKPGIINLVGRTSLMELTAVLKAAAVGVGPDSGPGHLAAAVRTPFVTLFGPTSPKRTAPFSYEHLVVKSEMRCSPCYQKRCLDQNNQCMLSIEVEKVAEKITEALAMDDIH